MEESKETKSTIENRMKHDRSKKKMIVKMKLNNKSNCQSEEENKAALMANKREGNNKQNKRNIYIKEQHDRGLHFAVCW